MNNKKELKFVPTCYRLLYLVKILQKKDVSLSEVEEEFAQNPEIEKDIQSETFLKYIKTLNAANIVIKKSKGKYRLIDFPTKINLSNKSLKTLIKLQNFIQSLYQQNLSLEYGKFINHLSKYLDKNKNKKIAELKSNNEEVFADYHRYKNILTTIDKYLQKGLKLEITTALNGKMILDSLSIEFYNKSIFISGYNQSLKELISIPIETVHKVKLSSQISRKIDLFTSITFKLKGKLAQKYKLKSNEKILKFDKEKQELIVITTKEDKELLFKRLIRYGLLCEIIGPKYVRNEFKEFISQIAGNYL